MSSKTSFFNFPLAKKGIKRTMPIWMIHFFVWLFALPVSLNNIFSNNAETFGAVNTGYFILGAAGIGGALSAFFFCAAMTEILSNYMYASSSASFYHSLPVKRSTVFTTHLVVSVAALLLPMVIISGLTAAVVSSHGIEGASVYAFQFLGYYTLMCIFFTGFSLLCCHITGHTAIGSLIYLILNFTSIAIYYVFSAFCEDFIYGFDGSGIGSNIASRLSPLFHFLSRGDVSNTADDRVYYALSGYVYALAVVGVLMIIAAWLFYRRRPIESAGEIISVPFLRPLFKYCVTAGCSVIIGVVIYKFSYDLAGHRYPSLLFISICLLLGAAIGYFGSEMMLRKKINVFLKSWKGFAVSSAAIIGIICALSFDLFNIEGYIPDAESVRRVYADIGSYTNYPSYASSPESIEKVMALHRTIVEHKEENLDYYYDRFGTSPDIVPIDYYNTAGINLRYELKNGRTVSRRYSIPLSVIYNDDTTKVIEYYKDPVIDVIQNEEILKSAYPGFFSKDSDKFYVSYISCEISEADSVGNTYTSEVRELKREYYDRVTELAREAILNHTIHNHIYTVLNEGRDNEAPLLPSLSFSFSVKPEFEKENLITDGRPHAHSSTEYYSYGLLVSPEAKELTAILTNPDSFAEVN